MYNFFDMHQHTAHTNDKIGPVDLSKKKKGCMAKIQLFNENDPVFFYYDVQNSVLITETKFVQKLVELVCNFFFSKFTYAQTSDTVFVTTDVESVLRRFFIYEKFFDRGVGYTNIDNERCANMQIFSKIRKLSNFSSPLFIQINYEQGLIGINTQFGIFPKY